MVLRPEKEDEARAIFEKWGLRFAIVGKTTDTKRFVVKHLGQLMADLPINELGDEAPEYDRPWIATPKAAPLNIDDIPAPKDYGATLLKLMGSPNLSSRRWVWEQYDHLIQGGTVQRPGGDAGVIRLPDSNKGLAVSVDVTPRYCEADPFEGGKQAVAEAWRNITAVGGLPLAVTDNLNFGNPERPETMGQLVGCIEGIGEACRKLDCPVVSGNVSLYNETNGEAILPTPAIGAVGLLDDVRQMATLAFKNEGDAILLVGGDGTHLGQSAYLMEILEREDGPPPPVNLEKEKRNGDFVRGLIRNGTVNAVHDISDGGMLVAATEMALAGNLGADLSLPDDIAHPHGYLFGENQARYLVTCPADTHIKLTEQAKALGIPIRNIGVVSGRNLAVTSLFSIALEKLRATHENWFPDYMAATHSK